MSGDWSNNSDTSPLVIYRLKEQENNNLSFSIYSCRSHYFVGASDLSLHYEIEPGVRSVVKSVGSDCILSLILLFLISCLAFSRCLARTIGWKKNVEPPASRVSSIAESLIKRCLLSD